MLIHLSVSVNLCISDLITKQKEAMLALVVQ